MSLPTLRTVADIPDVLNAMTLEEKLAQIVGLWLQLGADEDAAAVAPMQHEMLSKVAEFDDFVENGLGQLTRPLGSRVGEITDMLRAVNRVQRRIVERSRFGIPAVVHEEILTGLQLYGATTYPAPLAWGSAWNPELVERMGEEIGTMMKALDIHLGLAPVLDVVRDPRWGRVEECISEEPYAVGLIASAYVSGVQSAGVGATLKHFLAYSNSQAGRNLAPVHSGMRELLEIFAVPFEMAVKLAHPQAVMHSYAEIDGVPVASDRTLLTELLRDRWGFDGTVVADYFGVAFLHTLHDIAADLSEAARLGLHAGIDVELPTGNAYLAPLAERVRAGDVPVEWVDTAVERVLRQKVQLGALSAPEDPTGSIDLDPDSSREIARELGEQSIILLQNDSGILPLRGVTKLALVGANADSPHAMMGNYSFSNHIEVPDGTPLGISVSTVRSALAADLPGVEIVHELGCEVRSDHESPEQAAASIAAAVAAARGADVCVAVIGDRAGLFGRGTVGEGSDTDDLRLPGRQGELLDALLETGTPVVIVLVTGRPYPVSAYADRAAAIIQAFFPGEEGGAAIAGVLGGRLNPSGRLPVTMPRGSGGQPYAYRHPRLGGLNPVSNIDPAPLYAFGHGLSYTTFEHGDLEVASSSADTSGTVTVTCAVTNTGDRAGVDVVQLYVRDVVASVTRPLRQLVGWARVDLAAGASARVEFEVHSDRLGFVGRDLNWRVEPGEFQFTVAPSSAAQGVSASIVLDGPVRTLGEDRQLVTPVTVGEVG